VEVKPSPRLADCIGDGLRLGDDDLFPQGGTEQSIAIMTGPVEKPGSA
jgi:hypothetical protein